MEIKFKDKELKTEAFKNGLVLGIIVWVLSLLFSYVMFGSSSFWIVVIILPTFISFLVPVIASTFLTLDLRKKIGGYWHLRKAASGIFIMFLTAFILHTGFQQLFIKFVEPQWSEKIVNSVVTATENMLDKQGVDKSEIDKKVASAKEGVSKQKETSFGKIAQGYLINILFLFIFAFFFALIFKRNNPNPFATQTDEHFGTN